MNRVKQQEKIRVLFVAANPFGLSPMTVDEEIRAITAKIRASEYRDALDIQQAWAARPDDLLQYFNQYKPHIVHFSTHGSSTGEIVLSDRNGYAKPVSAEALKALFTVLKNTVRIVLLNACHSQIQAQAITSVVDCAIGMNNTIGDEAASIFSASFYRAICFGVSIQEAFEQGKVALQLEGTPEHTTPVLLTKVGVNASQIRIIMTPSNPATNEIQHRLLHVHDAIMHSSYDTAYQDIDTLIKTFGEEIAPNHMALLKYYEALVHLDGKRPYSQSPSIIQAIEGLLRGAYILHALYSYKAILAVVKYDFARAGLRKHHVDADKLLSEIGQFNIQTEDRENIRLLITCQHSLCQEYKRYLNI